MHSPEHLKLKMAQFADLRIKMRHFLSERMEVNEIQPGDYERFQLLSEDMLALIDFWGGSVKEERS